jgi:hypothetical protein
MTIWSESGGVGCTMYVGNLLAPPAHFSWSEMMPIALTDSEMDIVMRAAQPLAVNDREGWRRIHSRRHARSLRRTFWRWRRISARD